jgi:hypothetical protein
LVVAAYLERVPQRHLQVAQVVYVTFQQRGQYLPRPGAGEVQLGEVGGAVGELDLFADAVSVEVFDDPVGEPRGDVQPEGVTGGRRQVKDQGVGDRPGLVGGEEGFTTAAGGEVHDVVGAEVVQETAGFAAGYLDLAAVGDVEERGACVGLPVLGGDVAVAGGHDPAGVIGKGRSGLGSHFMKRGAFGH